MGPKGRNVVLENRYGSPKIVNDGVTIAKEVRCEDPAENVGAKLIQKVASDTNDSAGDGTTTACVLARELSTQGLKLISAGVNPVAVARGMMKAVYFVGEEIQTISKKVEDNKVLEQVATVSAGNDPFIGGLIAGAMAKVGNQGIVTVEGGNTVDTTIEIEEGMEIDKGYLSPNFITDPAKQLCLLQDATVFVTDKKLMAAADVVPILEYAARSGKPLFVVAEDVTGDALSAMVLNKNMGILTVCAIKAPAWGDRKKAMLEDIAILTGSQVFSEDVGMTMDKLTPEMFGYVRKVTVRRDKTIIQSGDNEEIRSAVKARVAQIRTQMDLAESDYDKDRLNERASRMEGGVAVIRVGAPTETELESKKLRVEDARNATLAALEEGVVAGGGTALCKLSKRVDKFKETLTNAEERMGADIVAKAMVSCVAQIAENSGYEGEMVVSMVRDNEDPDWGFNAETGVYENLIESGIIDPAKVERVALFNAGSVVSYILTTMAVVAEMPDDVPSSAFGAPMSGVNDSEYV